MKKVLFISNGFSEDLVAIKLINEVRKVHPNVEIFCLPIVGNARHFKQLGVRVIGPHWETPSEGLNYGSILLSVLDFFWGLPLLMLGQISSLFSMREQFDLTVTVGDYVGIAAAAMARVNAPLMHVWVCPAHKFPRYVQDYMRKHCVAIYTRRSDIDDFDHAGLLTKFVGNPLMDTFEITGEDFGLDKSRLTVGVLPGSRKNVYRNLVVIASAMEEIYKAKNANFLVSISPKLDSEKFKEALNRSVKGKLGYVVTSKFGDVLNRSDIILGLARTGNEQALCMGKPVITFWGKGFSMSEGMVISHWRNVLRKNAIALPPEPKLIAKAFVDLVNNPRMMEHMARRGREIMGERGGSSAVAKDIKEFFEKGHVRPQ